LSPPLLVLRVRGTVSVRKDVKETLKRLNLRRRHNLTVVPDTPDYRGMLQKAKDYIAWCKADKKLLAELLEKRARTSGWKPVTESTLKEHGFSSFEELADAIIEGRVLFHKLGWIKPYMALNPPRGGYKKPVKKPYAAKGVLGENPELPEILKRMV
jgi:large subunit ribosomal protein L30